MADQPVLTSIENAVATVTLNRPGLHNAFDDATIAELTARLRSIGGDPAVRAVVLRGAGKSFCAGADLAWMRRMADYGREENLADATALAELMRVLDKLPRPTVAVVHGAAYGGGVGLVACCDIAVATSGARFCLSEGKLGFDPELGNVLIIQENDTGCEMLMGICSDPDDNWLVRGTDMPLRGFSGQA